MRARDEGDIRKFALAVAPLMPFSVHTSGTPRRADYAWRVSVPRSVWAEYLTSATFDLDYTNFKEAVAVRAKPGRAGLYARVWATMLELQLSPDGSEGNAWRLTRDSSARGPDLLAAQRDQLRCRSFATASPGTKPCRRCATVTSTALDCWPMWLGTASGRTANEPCGWRAHRHEAPPSAVLRGIGYPDTSGQQAGVDQQHHQAGGDA